MTLTTELDLDMVQVDLYVKFLFHMSSSLARSALTDAHTDRTDSITLTTDAGGKNVNFKAL